jgi:hypothetical protein
LCILCDKGVEHIFDADGSQGFTATLSDFTPVTVGTETLVTVGTETPYTIGTETPTTIVESLHRGLVPYDSSEDDEEVDPTMPMGRGCQIRFERRFIVLVITHSCMVFGLCYLDYVVCIMLCGLCYLNYVMDRVIWIVLCYGLCHLDLFYADYVCVCICVFELCHLVM